MPGIVQFEIHASHPRQLINFYSQLFGWSFQQWDGAEFWQITTASEPSISAGLIPRRGDAPAHNSAVNAFICTVQVEDIDASLQMATTLGGQIAVEKMAIPNIGWLAYLKDPDGNLLGISQRNT